MFYPRFPWFFSGSGRVWKTHFVRQVPPPRKVMSTEENLCLSFHGSVRLVWGMQNKSISSMPQYDCKKWGQKWTCIFREIICGAQMTLRTLRIGGVCFPQYIEQMTHVRLWSQFCADTWYANGRPSDYFCVPPCLHMTLRMCDHSYVLKTDAVQKKYHGWKQRSLATPERMSCVVLSTLCGVLREHSDGQSTIT